MITLIDKIGAVNDTYAIANTRELAGHKHVNTLNELYTIPDAWLSPSVDNTDNDAIGQEWYVVGTGRKYRLKNWTNRKSLEGWEEVVNGSGSSNYPNELLELKADNNEVIKVDFNYAIQSVILQQVLEEDEDETNYITTFYIDSDNPDKCLSSVLMIANRGGNNLNINIPKYLEYRVDGRTKHVNINNLSGLLSVVLKPNTFVELNFLKFNSTEFMYSGEIRLVLVQ